MQSAKACQRRKPLKRSAFFSCAKDRPRGPEGDLMNIPNQFDVLLVAFFQPSNDFHDCLAVVGRYDRCILRGNLPSVPITNVQRLAVTCRVRTSSLAINGRH